MDTKTFADVHASIVKKPSVNSERTEALELVVSYAKDIVDFFPQFTIRQIPVMAAKIKALKEALEMVK